MPATGSPESAQELSATALCDWLRAACADTNTRTPFTVLVVHLQRSDRGSALAGSESGRATLALVATRLAQSMRPVDRFAVLGPDELGLVLPGIASAPLATLAATRVLRELSLPFEHSGRTVLLAPTVGGSFYPEHAITPDGLLGAADSAARRARALPTRLDLFHHHSLRVESAELLGELRQALRQNELAVWLQPQYSVDAGDFRAAEALVRWPRPPELPQVHAGLIAELAEQNGLMGELTEFVMHGALRHLRTLGEQGIRWSVGVNLSPSLLSDGELPERIRLALEVWDVDPQRLTLEVTESSLMNDIEGALAVLTQLKRLGTRLSIDDFGTGYSSLAYLRRMPLDELKIDQVFIRNLLQNESDQQITRTVIDLSHNFKLEAVAEGVETRAAMDYLSALGCDLIQGFHLGRPMPIENIPAWWARRRDPLG